MVTIKVNNRTLPVRYRKTIYFKTEEAMQNRWTKHCEEYELREIFVNNGYGIEYKEKIII